MAGSTEYVTLMASLPALGAMLAAKHPPINEARLRQRLQMLRPEHQDELRCLMHLLTWAHQALTHTDTELVREARRTIPRMQNPVIAELARQRLELRTSIAALRRRAAGQDSAPIGEPWGFGRYVRRIETHWREPGFGVENAFPWILAARTCIENGDTTGMERIALQAAWQQTARLAGAHAFDFEAVALYVVQWNILDRWTRYDAQAAAARFGALVDAALAAEPQEITRWTSQTQPAA